MPELPEVETVRQGLQRWVSGRTISSVEVRHPRAIRRHVPGAEDFVARLLGMRVGPAARRGKYLWLPLSDADLDGELAAGTKLALIGHLGMSGQLLVQPADADDEKHLHVRIGFSDGGPELRFVDQRTFGGLLLDELVPAVGESIPENGGASVPSLIAHIARDPLDPAFDDAAFLARLRRRDSAIKRALLDQSLISGVGNIYADEALWRAKLHGERVARKLTRPVATDLLAHVRAVLTDALVAGGTSFDSLYVNVNGESGYFGRDLAVYGREGEPCRRCGTAIRRASFMNRSSFFCPHCQRPPRP